MNRNKSYPAMVLSKSIAFVLSVPDFLLLPKGSKASAATLYALNILLCLMKLEKFSSSTLQNIVGFVSSFCFSNDTGNLFSPFRTQSSEAGDWIKRKIKRFSAWLLLT